MTKLKAGDRVKIVLPTDPEERREAMFNSGWCSMMDKTEGKTGVISRVTSSGNSAFVRFEDFGEWGYVCSALKKVEENQQVNKDGMVYNEYNDSWSWLF